MQDNTRLIQLEKEKFVSIGDQTAITVSNGSDNLASKVIESGGYTYIAKAAPGTTEATAKWKAYRYDSNGTKTYADGNSNFDNVATDLTSLTYF